MLLKGLFYSCFATYWRQNSLMKALSWILLFRDPITQAIGSLALFGPCAAVKIEKLLSGKHLGINPRQCRQKSVMNL